MACYITQRAYWQDGGTPPGVAPPYSKILKISYTFAEKRKSMSKNNLPTENSDNQIYGQINL